MLRAAFPIFNGLRKLLTSTFNIEFQHFFADKMIKLSQQNKIDWFASLFSLDFEFEFEF